MRYDLILRRLQTAGWRRGRAGSRTWMIVASVAVGLRLLRRVSRNSDDILYRTRVVPGDRFEIFTKAPTKR
jgi:hypothetical protein